MEVLTQRERDVLLERLKTGHGGKQKTDREVADELGISPALVCLNEHKAIKKLGKRVAKEKSEFGYVKI